MQNIEKTLNKRVISLMKNKNIISAEKLTIGKEIRTRRKVLGRLIPENGMTLLLISILHLI